MDIERIHPHLEDIVGRRLQAVRYHCLMLEAKADDLLDPEFYFGGEVEIRFFEEPPLFMAADQSDTWLTDYTVAVSRSSFFFPCTLKVFDVTDTPVWRRHVSQPVIDAAVLGWDGECHIVRIGFATGVVLVGCSRMGKRFGGGDDVAVRSQDDANSQMRGMEGIEERWSVGAA